MHDTAPWYRQFWPWFLIVLPGAVVVASFVTLGIAIRHADSEVHDPVVKDGLAISAQRATQAESPWRHVEAVLQLQGNTVQVEIHGSLHAVPERLTLLFIHPFEDSRDFRVDLQSAGPLQYRGTLPPDLHGRWHIELSQPEADDYWQLRADIELPATQTVHLHT